MSKLYSLAEAAEQLGLTVHALRRAADRGVLRTERIGPLRVVTAEEVERYRREHKGKVGLASTLATGRKEGVITCRKGRSVVRVRATP